MSETALQVAVLVLFLFNQSHGVQWQTAILSKCKSERKLTCKETESSFKHHFVNKSTCIGEDQLTRFSQCFPAKMVADGSKVAIYTLSKNNGSFYFLPEWTLPKKTVSWGYIIEFQQDNIKNYSYINFGDKGTKETKIQYRVVKLQPNVYFSLQITFVPYNVKAKWSLKLDNCSYHTLPTVANISTTEGCQAAEDMYKLATLSCQEYPNSIKHRTEFLKNRLCPKKKHEVAAVAPAATSSDTKYLLIITGFGLIVLFLVLLAYTKRKQIFKRQLCKQFSSNTVEELNTVGKEENIRSIMILHRPGCEGLDAFLRDLACILSAHNIDVRLSLLERSKMDSGGGIASYIQSNMKQCDYVCIMISEAEQDPPLLSHKPFQVALQLLNGLTFHTNKAPKCIPIYLAPYKQAALWFPSALLTSTTRGFQLPQDVRPFLKHLLSSCSDNLIETDELIETNIKTLRLAYNRMLTFAEKVTQEVHSDCWAEKCSKGQRFFSKSNLSAAWSAISYSSPSLAAIDQMKSNYNISKLKGSLDPRGFHYLWGNRCHSYDKALSQEIDETSLP